MNGKKIKWGILGTSFISEVMAEAIQSSTIAELSAIASRSAISATAFATKFSIQTVYDSYETMLADEKIDAVYIGLPNHLHAEWVVHCANAGKHILCEKPFALNVEEAQQAFAAVKNANVFCMEALMYGCHPFIHKIKSLFDANIIGDVKLFNATYTANIAELANSTAGGAIRNLGCYPMSLVRLLVGSEPEDITSIGRMNLNSKNDSQSSVLLRFPNNVMATISTADDVDMFYQFDVYGTKGRLSVTTNPWKPEIEGNIIHIYSTKKSAPDVVTINVDKPLYTYQIDTLCNNILSGTDHPQNNTGISWEHSLGNIRALEAWRQQVCLTG